MSTKEIFTAMDGTVTDMFQLFNTFTPEQINVIPFEGSWTAGQLAQHVCMSGSGFVELMNGPVKQTERKPDEHVAKIKQDFLNFDVKMVSPDFVVPPQKSYFKDDLNAALQNMKKGLGEAIETLDLSMTCLAFEIPGMGFLTRLESTNFVLYHTQRHIHQLKNISQKLVEANPANVL